MASCVESIATAFLTLALLLSSTNARISPTSSLIPKVCANKYVQVNRKFCIQVLESEPRVVAATDTLSISIALIEAAISNATKTQSYIRTLLRQPGLKPDFRYALRECDTGYTNARGSFGSALEEVKDYKEYDTATYDIKIAYTDNIDQCRTALDAKRIENSLISKGNQFIAVFGQVSFETVDSLPTVDF